MKPIESNILEQLRMYYLGSQGRKPKKIVIEMHPQMVWQLMETKDYWVEFPKNEDISEFEVIKHWRECIIEENPEMPAGFKLEVTP